MRWLFLAIGLTACGGAKDGGDSGDSGSADSGDSGGGDSGDSGGGDTGTADRVPVDVLLLVDGSASATGYAGPLLAALPDLTAGLGLGGVIGVSTVDAEGHAGGLVAPLVATTDGDVETALFAAVACHAICWDEDELPSDPEVECKPPYDLVTSEILDCVCGAGAWRDHCGGGNEEPLEAAFEGWCRAVDAPPAACFDGDSELTAAATGSSAGLLRDGVRTALLVVSDEGDGSRRLATGSDDPSDYVTLYAALGIDPWVAYLGPPYDGSRPTCSGAQPWGVERLYALGARHGITPEALFDAGDGCAVADLGASLDALGRALSHPE